MGVNIFAEGMFEGEGEVFFGSGEVEQPAAMTVAEEESLSFNQLLVLAADKSNNRAFRKCQACHDVTKGGPHKIGPNLWNILGAPPGSKDFAYSTAMTGKGGVWDYQTLNEFLAAPSKSVPGTKMTFAGIRTAEERAALIAFLRTTADSPTPLPEVPVDDTPETSTEGDQGQ